MTRIYEAPDPHPGRVFRAILAQGILLWEEGLEERSRIVWEHSRKWSRREGLEPLPLIAFVGARASLTLLREEDWKPEDVVIGSVHDHADDYLRRLLYCRSGFHAAVCDLADQLAANYSPLLEQHYNTLGTTWYVVGAHDGVRRECKRLAEDLVLARITERFAALYPEIAATFRGAADANHRFTQAIEQLYQDYSALREPQSGVA